MKMQYVVRVAIGGWFWPGHWLALAATATIRRRSERIG